MTNRGARAFSSNVGKLLNIPSWLLILPSSIVGLLLGELLCHLFFPALLNSGIPQDWNRIVFLSGANPIFENHDSIFTYSPHNEIRNVTAFFSNDGYKVEYDYRFRTNNFGLVQDADISPGLDSLLLLGDSFTEGQGAEPWFRLVSQEIKELGYQPVNGGLMATGFQQWRELERYVVGKKIRVGKLLVPFISDDYRRPVVQIPPAMLECLSSPARCQIEDSYVYRYAAAGADVGLGRSG